MAANTPMPAAMDMLLKLKLIKFYPFEQINEAFAESGSGKCIKAVLRMDG